MSACLNNALTYALAEKYDIQGLKELAKHKFKLRSSSGWTEANLLTLLEVVYNTTPTTDRGLRDIMSTICCSLIDCTAGKLLSSPRYQGLISKDGTLAFDALTKTYEKKRMLDRKVQTLEARVKQLETGLGNAEQTTQALASQLNSAKEWEEQEQETLKHLLSGETCYYCSQELRVSVEKHPVGTDKHLRVKCQSCGKILQKLKP